jgi:gluconate 5-dehydrogenase
VSHPLFDISGRTALVTGSTRGIGRALAGGLVEAGCTVVAHGRSSETVAAAASELGAAHGVAFDVTDPDAVVAGVAEATSLAGPLDILVNNAGIQHREPVLDAPDELWRRMIDTNLTSALLVGREVARTMVPRGSGKIVNVTSVLSAIARPNVVSYVASKGALKMLTQGMCAEWASSGVQVNALAPGYIQTELTQPLVDDPEFSAWLLRRTPAGRWGQTSDLVGALLFLASPASDFVNGHTLFVDGGIVAVI